MSKISHFLLKTCYFWIKNARFSKWYIIWSNRYKESIYRICSSLKIYFGLLKVKSKYTQLSFVFIIFSKKMQKNCIFVRFSTFSKNELKKWNLCMISNWYKKLMRIATHLIFFPVKAESLYFSTKTRVLLFNKKRALHLRKTRV